MPTMIALLKPKQLKATLAISDVLGQVLQGVSLRRLLAISTWSFP